MGFFSWPISSNLINNGRHFRTFVFRGRDQTERPRRDCHNALELQDCESKDSRNVSDIGNFVLQHAVIKSLQYSLDVILYMFLDGRSCATLENILVFVTGTSEVPPLGFRPSPSIQFWDDIRPRSNTHVAMCFSHHYIQTVKMKCCMKHSNNLWMMQF